jgi:HlyD family secretion protein
MIERIPNSKFHIPHFEITVVAVLVCLLAGSAFWRRTAVDPSLTAFVRKGPLTARLTTTGILRPAQSITYRSPLAGREAEITELAPEGLLVNEGDLLVRLDTTELQRELERAHQEVRQSQLEIQVADIERREAEAALTGVSEGEGALAVEETRTRLQLAEKKVERLRLEYEQLQPLLEKGFITRDELKKTADELEQSEEEAALTRKRADVVIKLSHPRESQRASLQLAQKESALENTRAKAQDARARLALLIERLEQCRIYARRTGLVVYEEFLGATPRRKIRVGDRVTGSQGIVTIPEVNRMLLEASVSEAEVHRVRAGLAAVVRVEAFPDLRLPGRVARVGSLARSSADRPFEDKRFDLIVELDSTPPELRPEMSARADIVVGTRSDALLLPITAIFDRQGQLVAHVVRPYGIEARPVDVGESSEALVEIVSGLTEGETVMLTDPGHAVVAAAPGGKIPAVDRAQRSQPDRGRPYQPR